MNKLEKIILTGTALIALGAGLVYAFKKDYHTTPTEPTPIVTPAPKFTQEPTITLTPTPALSQYQKQALEEIAVIRQKEPGLADLLAVQEWARDEGMLRSAGLKYLTLINYSISENNYTIDSLITGTNNTTIFANTKDAFKRTALLQVVKSSIPVIADFLSVRYERSLLLIDFDASISGAAGGTMLIKADDWTLRNKTHEAAHEVYEGGTFVPYWLQEGVAEFAGIYAVNKLPETLPNLASMLASPDWKGKDKSIPNFYEGYKSALDLINKADPSEVAGSTSQGYVFLYEFRELVGHKGFAEAMGHLYNVRIVKGATDRNAKLTNKDIEAILAQKVPVDKLPAFKQLYQNRIYNLQTTK